MFWESCGIHLPLDNSRQNLRRRSKGTAAIFVRIAVRAAFSRGITMRLASRQLAKLHILEGDLVALGFKADIAFIEPNLGRVHQLAVHH